MRDPMRNCSINVNFGETFIKFFLSRLYYHFPFNSTLPLKQTERARNGELLVRFPIDFQLLFSCIKLTSVEVIGASVRDTWAVECLTSRIDCLTSDDGHRVKMFWVVPSCLKRIAACIKLSFVRPRPSVIATRALSCNFRSVPRQWASSASRQFHSKVTFGCKSYQCRSQHALGPLQKRYTRAEPRFRPGKGSSACGLE